MCYERYNLICEEKKYNYNDETCLRIKQHWSYGVLDREYIYYIVELSYHISSLNVHSWINVFPYRSSVCRTFTDMKGAQHAKPPACHEKLYILRLEILVDRVTMAASCSSYCDSWSYSLENLFKTSRAMREPILLIFRHLMYIASHKIFLLH